CQQHNSHPWTF
nr:immunoglobulin light chain junction region [Macaca mulatta]MOV75149.1 immunoglobulin light chain junction region [Macaca mulatta]MOW56291.1 immunoglobulin light chain junction region [Macaca mulatta]